MKNPKLLFKLWNSFRKKISLTFLECLLKSLAVNSLHFLLWKTIPRFSSVQQKKSWKIDLTIYCDFLQVLLTTDERNWNLTIKTLCWPIIDLRDDLKLRTLTNVLFKKCDYHLLYRESKRNFVENSNKSIRQN